MTLAIDDVAIEGRILPLYAPRAISRETNVASRVIQVQIAAGGKVGWGEACPMPRYGQDIDQAIAQMNAVRGDLLALRRREDLAQILPPGGLRNAVDTALWDLEAKLSGRDVEQRLNLEVRTVQTVYTVSLDTPERMAEEAARERARPILKIKLGHFEGDIDRLRAIRAAAPQARLVVDANEGWDLDQLRQIAPIAAGFGVELIEQPLHADDDLALAGYDCPLPLCADESCHTRASVPGLSDRYDMINIKLDKSGGLTEALALAEAGRAEGLQVMIGCTSATTLAIAPAFLVAQACVVCDLDAPLYNARQEREQIAYDGSEVSFSASRTWGRA